MVWEIGGGRVDRNDKIIQSVYDGIQVKFIKRCGNYSMSWYC